MQLGSGGRCNLWPKPLEMALFSGCDKWYSYCIITSNSCSHILLNSWEKPLQLSLVFTTTHERASALQFYGIFDCFSEWNYGNETIDEKFVSESLRKRKNVRRHEAKLVSIFPMNILWRETNLLPALSAFWGRVYSGEKSEVLYLLCLK